MWRPLSFSFGIAFSSSERGYKLVPTIAMNAILDRGDHICHTRQYRYRTKTLHKMWLTYAEILQNGGHGDFPSRPDDFLTFGTVFPTDVFMRNGHPK